jgi:hypothetical protein
VREVLTLGIEGSEVAMSYRALFAAVTAAALLAPAAMAAPLHKKALGKIGGWEIARYTTDRAGRKLAYCEAKIITGTETGLRFVVKSEEVGQAFGFSGYGSAAIGDAPRITHWINGDKANPTTDVAKLETDETGFEWTMISETNDEPGMFADSLPNARKISFAYPLDGKIHVETFTLRSSNAVVTRLIDCRDGR